MNNLHVAIDNWVEQYPFLARVANLQKMIATAKEEYEQQNSGILENISNWEKIVEGIKKGIPALKAVEVDSTIIDSAAALLIKLVDIPAEDNSQQTNNPCQSIKKVFSEKKDMSRQIIERVLQGSSAFKDLDLTDVKDVFILFLAWSALSGVLTPLKRRVRDFQQEYKWLKNYCPVCGHLPVMGQLVQVEIGKGRERELVCGCCQMRWNYRRIGCPYCGNEDQKTLKIIELEEVPDLRIDTCEKCKGYIKIYTGEGNEEVLLADWSTLHLDVIGHNKGFKRMDSEIYDV